MDDRAPFFRTALLDWSARNPRPLPWKGERDPYRIWLSEIILQQTRVEQGTPYYHKFIELFPDVHALAHAEEDVLLKAWEGLGYYARARNLHAAAKFIATELKGEFPRHYDAIRALKGVGDYTAAAIASFAYGLPHAVLDGNVLRVLSRFFAMDLPIDAPQARKTYAALAEELLDRQKPAVYNQAIMDFGATCCVPKNPQCRNCPLSARCGAFLGGDVHVFPVKAKQMLKTRREFHYLIFNRGEEVLMRKRSGKDIWKGLWEFPHTETPPRDIPFGSRLLSVSAPMRQLLTHREIHAVFYELELPATAPADIFDTELLADCVPVERKNLKKNIAVPRVIDCYLTKFP